VSEARGRPPDDARLVLPDPATELGAALSVAQASCDEADGIAMASFRRALDIEAKADRSFVTAADRAVEEAIRSRITATFPDHGLVGEEHGELAAASGRRWFIDPIDGTHSFMRGIPVFATLLALEVEGRLQLGVVSAPALRRRWFAWQGGGAWAVETGAGGWAPSSAVRVRVSGVAELGEASVVYSSVPSIARSGLAPGFGSLLERTWRDRGLGDFWGYVLVAEGAAEVMVEAELATWDLAGPRAVLEEAGARVTDLQGGDDMPARGVLATNGLLHEVVLAALRGAGTGPT
jgi:histidinol-phosphatase